MTFTYDDTSTTATDLAEIRLRIGDTLPSDALLTDQEINGVIALGGGNVMASANCAQRIAAQFARKVSLAEGAFRISLQQRYQHYTDLHASLQAEARRGTGLPYAGGISVTDVQTVAGNTDREKPAFTTRQFDAPLTGQST